MNIWVEIMPGWGQNKCKGPQCKYSRGPQKSGKKSSSCEERIQKGSETEKRGTARGEWRKSGFTKYNWTNRQGFFILSWQETMCVFSHSINLSLCLLILRWKKSTTTTNWQHNPYNNPYRYYLLSKHLCKYYCTLSFRISYKKILCNYPRGKHYFYFPCAKAFKSMKLKQDQIIFVNKRDKVNKFQLWIVPNSHRIKYLTWHKVPSNQWIRWYKASYYCKTIRTT